MLSAISIARNAFQGKPGIVALSLGAYGATMTPSTEYSGEYGAMTSGDLVSFHQDRLVVFLKSELFSDVDIFAFETLPRLIEVHAVRSVMEALAPEQRRPYWGSCVFPSPNNDTLPDGSTIGGVVHAVLSSSNPPFALGINCTKLRKVPNLITEFEHAIDKQGYEFPRLVLYPDGASGQVYDTTRQQWVSNTSVDTDAKPWHEQVHKIVKDVQRRGKWKGIIVGGCCKTGPSHIAALRKLIDGTTNPE